MKMKNIVIILILLFPFSNNTGAQSHDINHKKYWYYRSRLVNDFMKIGKGLGESLPASHRAKANKHGPVMYFGADAVSQLGEYISVLATEYGLLKNSGQSADSTVRELYYALEAFNRLDYNAESIWGKPNELNGFFIRQDVPCNFIKDNMFHFNYDLNFISQNALPDYASPSYVPGWTDNGDPDNPQFWYEYGYYGGFISNSYENRINYGDPSAEQYCNYQNQPSIENAKNLAMSLDQTIFVFIGCALINKYVDENIVYKVGGVNQSFMDGEVSIKNEARRISSRMLSTLQGTGNWRIKMPDGTEVDNEGGGVVWEYSFPFSEADCKIHKSNNLSNSIFPCSASNDLLSSSVGLASWTAISSDLGVIADVAHPDNAPKTMELSVACNCDYTINVVQILIDIIYSTIEYVIGWIQHWVNGDPIPVYGWQSIVGNVTETRIQNRAGLFNLHWGPLLRKVLHGGTNISYNIYDYVKLLNDAPCSGPQFYSQSDPDTPNYPWASVDLLEHPGDANDVFVSPQKRKGEFNGLDYMLYHNAYYLDNPNQYSGVYDQRYRELYTLNFPYTIGALQNYGSNSFPAIIKANEYITASNNLFSTNFADPNTPTNANVTYLAGKKIHLLPGFHVEAGSNFHALIQKPVCNDDTNSPFRVLNSDSGLVTSKKMVDFNQPTEFVIYPTKEDSSGNFSENTIQTQTSKSGTFIQNGENTELNIDNKIEIIPNPNSGQFSIKLNFKKVGNISIMDILGNKVYFNEKINQLNEIPVSLTNLSKGIYMLRAETNNGEMLNKTIIIQ